MTPDVSTALVDGLPVGVQNTGAALDEVMVLRAGCGVEKLGTMTGQHPQVS